MAIIVIILTATLGFVLYKLSVRNFDYWKDKGVSYVTPIPVFGNFFDVLTLREPIGHFFGKYYKQFKSPYFGMFVLNTPVLVVKDTNLLKSIMVKDFNKFADHVFLADEECDPLTSKMLFVIKNPDWRLIRSKLSPIFTSGKIKAMMKLIAEVAEEMNNYLDIHNNQKSVDAKELSAKYTTDVIASCAFGINANSFREENAAFRTIGRKMFGFTFKSAFRQMCYFVSPKLAKLLKMSFWDPSVYPFMRNVLWKTFEEREKTNCRRKDVIDTVFEIRKQGIAESSFEFVGDWVVALSGQFFAAGFETSGTTLSFALYELCMNSSIQTKLRSEIKSAVLEHKGLTYEAIQSMQYIHMVISETLRKYPALPFLDRVCIEDYKICNTDIIIEKGTAIYIPLMGLHHDEKYFPDPDKYDPERFSIENKRKLPAFAYLPFGEGPRNCIGERFGLIAIKLAIAHILLEYNIVRTADTPLTLNYDPKSFLLASKAELSMRFEKLVLEDA